MEDPILIRKVKEPFGWLSNMSAHHIDCDAVRWTTAEHLFQALRFTDWEQREQDEIAGVA